MADNVQASDISGSSGPRFASASLSFSGDPVNVPICALGVLTGSEGSWTFTMVDSTHGLPTLDTGIYNITPPTLSDGDEGKLQLTSNGSLRVSIAAQQTSFTTNDGGQNAHNSVLVASPIVIGGVSSAAAPSDVGGDSRTVNAWYLRNGAAAVQITASGALIPGDATNGLKVQVATSALPSGASTGANQTAIQTPIAPASATATKGQLLGVQYNSTQATFTDGQQGSLQVSARGAALVATGADTFNVTVNAALPAGSNAIGKLAANSGVTIGAVEIAAAQTLATVTTVSTVTNVATIGTSVTPGTSAAHLGKAEDAAHSSGDTGVFILAVQNATHTTALSGTDGDYTPIAVDSTGKVGIRGTYAEDAASSDGDLGIQVLTVRKNTAAATSGTDGDYQPLITDTNGRLHVNVGNTVTVSGSGSFTVTGTITAANTAGDVAHDGADSGNPVKVGGQARTTNPTAVSDGDRANLITDKLGKLIAVGAIRELKGVQQTKITSSTSETTIVTAVASTFLDLYGLIITNTSASACKVTIKDSTAGTTRFVYEVPAGDTRGFMVPVDSAVPQATVNTNWTATCGSSVDSIEVSALYVKNL